MNNHNLEKFRDLFENVSSGSPKWRVALYVRLSKDDGKSVSLSVINQIKRIAKFLKQFDDYEIIDIYIDDGISGTDFDRVDYLRLIDDVDSRIVNCIIVKDLTRFSRNFADGIKELDTFVLKKKLRFISLGLPSIDTFLDPKAISSPEVYQALQSAEDFARQTSIKVRQIQELMRDSGETTGGFPPYGFLLSDNSNSKEWVIDPYASEIVKQIFDLYVSGMSINGIAKRLNSLGILNPTAYKQSIGLKYYHPHAEKNSGLWYSTTVSRILEDKNNIGYAVHGKSSSFDHKRHKQERFDKSEYIIVANSHDKIISDDIFELATRNKSQNTRVLKNSNTVHLFANLVYCSKCDRAMKRTNAGKYQYLVCRTYREMGAEYCETKNTIRYEVLEENVLKSIQVQISLIANLKEIVERINKHPAIERQSIRLKQLIESNKKELEKAEHIIDSSYYDWKNGDISKEQYQRIRTEIEAKLEQLRKTAIELSTQQRQMEKGINSNFDYFQTFLKYGNITQLNRALLLEVVDRIYINEHKEGEIVFKYKDQYLLILDFIENNMKLISENEDENNPKTLKNRR